MSGCCRYQLCPIAGEDALRLIWGWRNHPAVRERLFNDRDIDWPEHLAWWTRLSQDPRRAAYLFCDGEEPLGFTQFYDISPPNACYWGFYLRPPDGEPAHQRLATWLALEALSLRHAFGPLGCREVWDETFAFNTPVLDLHRRFGFTEVRRFSRPKGGQPETVVVMRVTRESFVAAHPEPVPLTIPTLRAAFLGSAHWDLAGREWMAAWQTLGRGTLEVVPWPFGQYRTLLRSTAEPLLEIPWDALVFAERLEDFLEESTGLFDGSPRQTALLEARLDLYLEDLRLARQRLPGVFFVLDLAPGTASLFNLDGAVPRRPPAGVD
ncbi:hypothetical protein CCP4SC76_1010002 [Gammaproteobacteria bacterium]